MLHNLFLHSALVLSRKIPRSIQGIEATCRFYMMESGLTLMVTFLINVSIISTSGAVCNSSNINPKDQAGCQDLDLNKASFLLSGFLDLTWTPWIQILLTRCLAIVPSLIVAVLRGSAGAGRLIIIASMILSFELPFALTPLLKFTGSKVKMETYANSPLVTTITWVIGTLIMVINMYHLAISFIKFLLHGHLKLVEAVFLGIFGISVLAVYLAGIAYLVLRKTKNKTDLLPSSTT